MKPLHLPYYPIAMELSPVISFDNTQFAFEYKSEKELKWKPKVNLDEMMETAWKWELEQAKKK